MQPHISKIRRDLNRRNESSQFIKTKRSIVPPQQVIDGRNIPRRIAKLENIAMRAGQARQEFFQPLEIQFPGGRELKQNRTQAAAQQFDGAEELLEAVLGIL